MIYDDICLYAGFQMQCGTCYMLVLFFTAWEPVGPLPASFPFVFREFVVALGCVGLFWWPRALKQLQSSTNCCCNSHCGTQRCMSKTCRTQSTLSISEQLYYRSLQGSSRKTHPLRTLRITTTFQIQREITRPGMHVSWASVRRQPRLLQSLYVGRRFWTWWILMGHIDSEVGLFQWWKGIAGIAGIAWQSVVQCCSGSPFPHRVLACHGQCSSKVRSLLRVGHFGGQLGGFRLPKLGQSEENNGTHRVPAESRLTWRWLICRLDFCATNS